MTASDIDCILQQKDTIYYHVIAVAIGNGLPRQNHMEVVSLTIVQLVKTSKQITNAEKNCALCQKCSTDCTIVITTADKGAPRQHHMDMLCLNIGEPACTKKNELLYHAQTEHFNK